MKIILYTTYIISIILYNLKAILDTTLMLNFAQPYLFSYCEVN